MKSVIVTCFQSNEERVSFIAQAFKQKGYETRLFTTDFLHKTKKQRSITPNGFEIIPTIKYKKNISFLRLWSHYRFSNKAFLLIEEYKPDIIWIEAPCNSLIKKANQYKKKYPNVKIIIDMIDMWPESLPVKNKNLLPLKLWKSIRTNNINCADIVVSECNLYIKTLSKEYKKDIKVLYWSKQLEIENTKLNLPKDKLALCYIGSINNIIDIDFICNLVQNADCKCELHVIGTGEKKDELIAKAEMICDVFDYGETYDKQEKMQIAAKCHAGLNVYKEGLYIGLTVKSLDYMQLGLPLINSINGDTNELVTKYDIGINVDRNSKLVLSDLVALRKKYNRIQQVFIENFSKDVFVNKCEDIIEEVEV